MNRLCALCVSVVSYPNSFLADGCIWNEVIYGIFVSQKVDAGLRNADAGRTIPDDEDFPRIHE